LNLKSISLKYDKKNEIKYEVFIGCGNNKNLIKNVIQKRWWWKISN
jgi:hypothetical protein